MDQIKDIEYDYSDEYSDEDDLYTEEFYGNYDEAFLTPEVGDYALEGTTIQIDGKEASHSKLIFLHLIKLELLAPAESSMLVNRP